jgi:hypothetical protein
LQRLSSQKQLSNLNFNRVRAKAAASPVQASTMRGTTSFDTLMDALLVGCLLALILNAEIATNLFEWLCRPNWAPVATSWSIGLSIAIGSRNTLSSQG